MARVVTFEDKGVAKITDYSDSTQTNDEIIKALHARSYRENLADELLKNLSTYNKEESIHKISKNSLGYAIEKATEKGKVYSTISRIEFHYRNISHFGVTIR